MVVGTVRKPVSWQRWLLVTHMWTLLRVCLENLFDLLSFIEWFFIVFGIVRAATSGFCWASLGLFAHYRFVIDDSGTALLIRVRDPYRLTSSQALLGRYSARHKCPRTWFWFLNFAWRLLKPLVANPLHSCWTVFCLTKRSLLLARMRKFNLWLLLVTMQISILLFPLSMLE